MCWSSSPQQTQNKNNGENSNLDSNSVTIIETINNHGSLLTILLMVVTILLLLHALAKIYTWHIKKIQSNERQRNIPHIVNNE